MSTPLSGTGRDLYEQLTARTFYVVDTEFTTHDGQHHLVSLAVVPVVGGRRTRTRDQLYRVINPGVPIDPDTAAVHGFSDHDVDGKPDFNTCARLILDRLREDDAVFVCHTPIDAHVLRAELQRLDQRAAAGQTGIRAGVADLPDLPVLDTQRLAAAVAYPGADKNTRLTLHGLCDLTGVARPRRPHHARDDATATADALVELLRHTAEHHVYWTFEDLLAAASGGTTHNPAGPDRITPRRTRAPRLPAAHVARHTHPLTAPVAAGSAQAEAWLDMAAECAQLRCPYLRDEAAVAAAHNGPTLLRPLLDDLSHLDQPGQAGTLLGAVHALLTTDAGPPTLPARRALKWWTTTRPVIHASRACDRASLATACPSCRDGQPCPRDILHIAVADTVTLGAAGHMTDQRARQILAPTPKSPLNTWRKHHRDILAYALWRVARHLFDEGHDEHAYTAVDHGIAMNLHTADPRFTELACERLVETGQADTAFTVAADALAHRSTDPGYDDLADWVLYTRTLLHTRQPRPRRTITHPRRARPAGHTNPRLYT